MWSSGWSQNSIVQKVTSMNPVSVNCDLKTLLIQQGFPRLPFWQFLPPKPCFGPSKIGARVESNAYMINSKLIYLSTDSYFDAFLF